MFRIRLSLGSLAASTALVCVLSLAPYPVSPGGGFLELPLAHAQCCFTAETQVLMADGSERPIAEVRPGDRVFGRDGRINRVDGIYIVPLGPRMLYGINQHAPFFTAEHPFLTPGGWRALDRAATRLEMPGLSVAEMAAGDVLITASAESGETAGQLALAPAVTFGHRVLNRLTCRAGKSQECVYNLSLNGNHSYVANGFVVHNKGGDNIVTATQAAGDSTGLGGASQLKSGDARATRSAQVGDQSATTLDQPAAGGASSGSQPPNDTAPKPGGGETGAPGAFSGSAAPAGPDLTKSEEEALISRGWK